MKWFLKGQSITNQTEANQSMEWLPIGILPVTPFSPVNAFAVGQLTNRCFSRTSPFDHPTPFCCFYFPIINRIQFHVTFIHNQLFHKVRADRKHRPANRRFVISFKSQVDEKGGGSVADGRFARISCDSVGLSSLSQRLIVQSFRNSKMIESKLNANCQQTLEKK